MKSYPLMKNNIDKNDLIKVISHLKRKFEKMWSKVGYSVFVNSGSANLISLHILKKNILREGR